MLSQFVSRRDELVLKRMRTGEVRDAELIVSIALPGVVSALLVGRASPSRSSPLLDQPLPVNPVLYAAAAVLTVIMFTAFAYWTAAWTRSAEAAQLTSMPIIILASARTARRRDSPTVTRRSRDLIVATRRAPRCPSSCGSAGSASTARGATTRR